jgi:hypothetical protein
MRCVCVSGTSFLHPFQRRSWVSRRGGGPPLPPLPQWPAADASRSRRVPAGLRDRSDGVRAVRESCSLIQTKKRSASAADTTRSRVPSASVLCRTPDSLTSCSAQAGLLVVQEPSPERVRGRVYVHRPPARWRRGPRTDPVPGSDRNVREHPPLLHGPRDLASREPGHPFSACMSRTSDLQAEERVRLTRRAVGCPRPR